MLTCDRNGKDNSKNQVESIEIKKEAKSVMF